MPVRAPSGNRRENRGKPRSRRPEKPSGKSRLKGLFRTWPEAATWPHVHLADRPASLPCRPVRPDGKTASHAAGKTRFPPRLKSRLKNGSCKDRQAYRKGKKRFPSPCKPVKLKASLPSRPEKTSGTSRPDTGQNLQGNPCLSWRSGQAHRFGEHPRKRRKQADKACGNTPFPFRTVAGKPGRPHSFFACPSFRMSRISVSNWTLAGGGGGGAAFSSSAFLNESLLMTLTSTKIENAIMTKSTVT
ncbi:hypothetical protein OFAG_02283 [Oxalobacter formigenes HOxBLS]|uniref:Uncharacterized protein n=1 Tax=Oxalobacter paraformigenes TaxID=556268 RepID=T5LPN6_9BURK|nr:hypothetical protein OFAG_02283 [Oxalobacter paraformigenes]